MVSFNVHISILIDTRLAFMMVNSELCISKGIVTVLHEANFDLCMHNKSMLLRMHAVSMLYIVSV